LRFRKKNTTLRHSRPVGDNRPMSLHDHARAAVAASGRADLRFEQAFEILRAYDEARAAKRPRHGSVADAADLPYPKDTIKWALLLVLGAIDAAAREPVKAGFVALAEWQAEEDVESAGFDSARLRRKIDPLALAREFAARASPGEPLDDRLARRAGRPHRRAPPQGFLVAATIRAQQTDSSVPFGAREPLPV
jgi:hypothetical protein